MKKVLYLGTDPAFSCAEKEYIHYPVIRLVPKESIEKIIPFDVCVITSKHTVKFLLQWVDKALLQGCCISIGKATTASLIKEGITPFKESSISTQEGMIEELQKLSKLGSVFYPRSSKARPFLAAYLKKRAERVQVVDLYDTITQKLHPIPSLQEIEEVVFTSPSTVEGFFSIFSFMPHHIKPVFQGPITRQAYIQAADNKNF